ncbi:MAG: sodium-dependent bicarbonate transport family permease, partial [Salibacteraceae bacterium]|nr:sodium-dependent bicarbonate transport family permease [Salibacteraceae bacterium]
AVAAAYGSVSAVTFVTAISFLEQHLTPFDGHMVAILAFMEAPAIIVGVLLIKYFSKNSSNNISMLSLIKHAITNGSVLLILGSLVIGYIASDQQANGIKPFTTDLFKGFLAIFLLDMGITSGQKLKSFFEHGWFTTASAVMFALVNGSIVAIISSAITPVDGNRFLLAVLAASASYIAVPAAMKIAVPRANPGIYLPMALAVTFPINITIGLPLYFYLITVF